MGIGSFALMFSIIYNFCRNTITTPRDYEGGDKCVETQHKVVDGKAELTKEPAPAFLLSKPVGEESTCIRLGLDYTVDSNSEMGLYDITDPAMGVVIKYKEGGFCCPYKTCNNEDYRQTTISISLRCADAVVDIPTYTYVGTTNNNCDYAIFFRSVHACPTECPRVNNNVCGSHGVCGYDEEQDTARCYCSSRYSGADCMTFKYKSLLSVNTLVIILTVVVTLVVILTILYVWNKLRKISVNPDAFDSLENKFNELGQMAY